MDRKLVLDLSHWDGDIDLAAWKQQRDLWGVIIKAGGNETNLGRYYDSMFNRHYAKAKSLGLHIGFYYYTVTTDVANAIKDANHFADLIDGLDYDLPCYMDVEDESQFELSKRELTDVIKEFCDRLNVHGYYSGIYTGGGAWLYSMYADELRSYANWIAWWRSAWPVEAGDIGMWQQGGMRLSDGHIVFGDEGGDYHDCDWCVVDYPSRIRNNQTKANNPSVTEPTQETTQPSEEQAVQSSQNEKPYLGTAKAVIDAAYGELGYYAPNDPEPGSKYGRWLAALTGEDWLAGPSNYIYWCCMFTSWCLDQGGVSMDGFPIQHTDLALNGGAIKYAVDRYDVQYGDIVIFNWDWDNTTDHIGFATGSFDGYGFTTIEGNVKNAVKEEYRQMGNVAYVLRPPYNSDDIPTVSSSVVVEPKNNRDGGKLDVDGIGGWNTIIDLENQLGVPETGWISGQDKSNRQYHRNMTNVTYEENGSIDVVEIQRKVGCEVDGQWGPNTSKAIQTWLVEKGYSVGPCGIDGYFGKDSVKALQTSLNDGAWK